MQSPSRRVVIFTGRYAGASTAEHVEALARAFPHWQFTVVQATRAPRAALRWKKRLRKLRKEPVSYPLELVSGMLGRFTGSAPVLPSDTRISPPAIDAIQLDNVSYRRVDILHSEETLAEVRALEPWLGVALAAPILKRSLFKIPEVGTINVHKSHLPSYRGMPPGFWELHDRAESSGVSVHWVDDGLDTGKLVLQEKLPIPPFSTPRGLSIQLDVLASDVLVEAVRKIEENPGIGTEQPPSEDPVRTEPSWLVRRRVTRAARQRRAATRSIAGMLRSVVKDLVLTGYARLWAPLRNQFRSARGQCHATILMYHRVSDAFFDHVTVGIEDFERQMEVLRRDYEVVDLETFFRRNGQARKQPLVAITFDDGYEDNFLAAVILRRLGLPATFFLSTGIVGTDRAFEHDIQRLGFTVPSLAWDQVDRMNAWGFRLGNHTVHHVNLGRVGTETALEEIKSARDTLRERYGERGYIPCLAYPFGQPEDITEEVRESLPALDVPWCCSAYGGVNPPSFDPLRVLRGGVSAHVSPATFRGVVEGWSGYGNRAYQ